MRPTLDRLDCGLEPRPVGKQPRSRHLVDLAVGVDVLVPDVTLVKQPVVDLGVARSARPCTSGECSSSSPSRWETPGSDRWRVPGSWVVPSGVVFVRGHVGPPWAGFHAAIIALLPDPLHAERARLLADPDRPRVPAGLRRRRHRRRRLLQLLARTGTPGVVAGSLIAAGGVYLLSRLPVDGDYLTDLLPGMVVMSIGLGAVFVGGGPPPPNAGVPEDKAGLAAALLNASQQLGGALGLAIFSAIAASPHRSSPGGPQPGARGADLGLSAGAAGQQHRPARRCGDRAAHRQHARRAGLTHRRREAALAGGLDANGSGV